MSKKIKDIFIKKEESSEESENDEIMEEMNDPSDITQYDLAMRWVSKEEINSTITAYDNSTVDRDITASLYGDNLIVIMLESFEWFAIDPYNTPHLWALKTGNSSDIISNVILLSDVKMMCLLK